MTIREGCRENEPNRDSKLPQFPLKPDLRSLPTSIFALEVHNYAIGQFDKDKLDLCSVARYLSHQTSVEDRGTILKRVSSTQMPSL